MSKKCPVPAREWWFEVLDPFREDLDKEVWLPINGITNFGWSGDMSTADASDFSSDGWSRNTVTGRGRSLSLDANYDVDRLSGERDSGQYLLDYYSKQVGCEGLATLRMFDPVGRGTRFDAWVNMSSTGGSTTDKTSITYELTVDGKPEALPYVQVTGISTDQENLELTPGAVANLTATLTPGTASNQKVTWFSSNENVALVDESGLLISVMGSGEGSATITGRTVNNNKTVTVAVTVAMATAEPAGAKLKTKALSKQEALSDEQ